MKSKFEFYFEDLIFIIFLTFILLLSIFSLSSQFNQMSDLNSFCYKNCFNWTNFNRTHNNTNVYYYGTDNSTNCGRWDKYSPSLFDGGLCGEWGLSDKRRFLFLLTLLVFITIVVLIFKQLRKFKKQEGEKE